MARNEKDREDLLGEATALTERAELLVQGIADPVVVGFRRNGAASIFFGADPVYQFNTEYQLRRGFLAGRLLTAQQGQLASLTRQRSAGEVQLLRHDFTPQETEEFLCEATEQLKDLHSQLATGAYEVIGQVPADGDVIPRTIAFLAKLGASMSIAAAPNVS